MPWWAWMLVGAGSVLLIEFIFLAVFTRLLGEEVYEEIQ